MFHLATAKRTRTDGIRPKQLTANRTGEVESVVDKPPPYVPTSSAELEFGLESHLRATLHALSTLHDRHAHADLDEDDVRQLLVRILSLPTFPEQAIPEDRRNDMALEGDLIGPYGKSPAFMGEIPDTIGAAGAILTSARRSFGMSPDDPWPSQSQIDGAKIAVEQLGEEDQAGGKQEKLMFHVTVSFLDGRDARLIVKQIPGHEAETARNIFLKVAEHIADAEATEQKSALAAMLAITLRRMLKRCRTSCLWRAR
jgi:hypothetical protein